MVVWSRLFSGVSLVMIWLYAGTDMFLLEGVVGLYLIVGIYFNLLH